MRYLNKIIFINSASVQYAEIELNGNVHLIGTQGVGKSTLLRAILFLYNANKNKLGIPREKKSFDEYYFEYQNSYVIYEIVRDKTAFCVLAYKVNGRVAFRFFDAAYKAELFIDNNKRAFESWDKIREAFGKEIYYTRLINSYKEFLQIIYGDNTGLKLEFRKYALMESKQYQNIPRTIQNVFLNSNLEAQFIKDTIIKSLSEEEFVIDIENYAKNHLRNLETQIDDIRKWFQKNKKGQIPIREKAQKVIEKHRTFERIHQEKQSLAQELANRMDYIQREKPALIVNLEEENKNLESLYEHKEKTIQIYRRKEQDMISEIDQLQSKILEADRKQKEYEKRNIYEIIQKVAQKNSLILEQKSLENEKNTLTAKFTEIRQKYDTLIQQVQNQQSEFATHKNTEINNISQKFIDNQIAIRTRYENLISEIKHSYETEKTKAETKLESLKETESKVQTEKATLRYKIFFADEIEQCKKDKEILKGEIASLEKQLLTVSNEIISHQKDLELESKELERTYEIQLKTEKEKQEDLRQKIAEIEHKIEQSQYSFYGWLNNNIPNWQNTIGKVTDENVLFHTELNPTLLDFEANTFFGVEVDLEVLTKRIKTVEEYKQEIKDFRKQIEQIQYNIQKLEKDKESALKKLKTKFKRKLNSLDKLKSEHKYQITKYENNLKKNAVDLNDLTTKAKVQKEVFLEKLESNLTELATQKHLAQEHLENIRNTIKQESEDKKQAQKAEIEVLEESKNKQIAEIRKTILDNQEVLEKRISELKNKQISAFENKGADTNRLTAIDKQLASIQKDLEGIAQNETMVIEYAKDKKELFDEVPQFKEKKQRLESNKKVAVQEHQAKIKSDGTKIETQKQVLTKIEADLQEFEDDEKKLEEFEKSEVYPDVKGYLSKPIAQFTTTKTALVIISEFNEKYYTEIKTFKELQQASNIFVGNFEEDNIFAFKIKLNTDSEFLNFAKELEEFIQEDKISEFEKRVNERFISIIQLISKETTELYSKKGEIEKIIHKINADFMSKNFVQAIKKMEMKTSESSNPVVVLLTQIKVFSDKNALMLQDNSIFTAEDEHTQIHRQGVDLLIALTREIEKYKHKKLTLSESFDLQFKIVENDNDSGWVEKLAHVGSEGTDVLIKAMINILLLNVFKDSASKKFKDFKLHCMMDEIGRLHPSNIEGILRFANERNILLINGSPTSHNATDYKYTYKLSKVQSKNNTKKYITKVNRLIKKVGI